MSRYPVIPFHRLSIATNLESEEDIENRFPHHTGFTSFSISSSFPDFVHAVDVISDAENIKKLLKMPFDDPSKSVSMVVHRIGKSILIDELDMAKCMFLAQDPDWKWLKQVLQSTSNPEALTRSTNDAPLERNLLSKYLSQSLSTNALLSCPKPLLENTGRAVNAHKVLPPLPEPSVEEKIPRRNPFARNIVWNFEDIRMLIGSDMPIFGDAEHPCVSLRLRNAKNPINILTGLDYWLDNLMCQVPEVLMCFHVDGIVQRYELYKTEDLPSMGGCKFSPSVVRDVARNILSFLRSNATQEGHTYWLFKAQNDDVVKLYDLTSLGEDFKAKMFSERNKDNLNEDKDSKSTVNGNNPFKTAVSMLLYKVARNLMESDERKCEMSTIRRLLINCLNLLDSKKYPQIATSAHYMLSDLLVPDEINPAYPDFPVFDSENQQASVENESTIVSDIGIRALLESNKRGNSCNPKVPNVQVIPNSYVKTDTHETVLRCKQSLVHVHEGFKYLDAIQNQKKNSGEEGRSQEGPKMCNPNEVIPMPYSSGDEGTNESMKIQIYVENRKQTPTWHEHFQSILFKKAFLVYVTLAELDFSDEKYGSVLRDIKRALDLENLLRTDGPSLDQHLVYSSFAWGVAGDSYMSMVKQWSKLAGYHEEYNSSNEADQSISERIESRYRDWIIKLPIDLEEAMLLAAQCFRKAEEILKGKDGHIEDYYSILKRLGNVKNEIGVFYMNQAAQQCQNNSTKNTSLEPHVKELFGKSLAYFEEGIRYFEIVKDNSNISLLNSNIGRLCRLHAFYGGCGNIEDRTEFSDFEFEQYSKAIEHYEKALKSVGNRKNNPVIWDSISWDLSSTLLTIGSLLQDFAPLSTRPKNEVEKLISDYLIRALKYCDLDNKGPKLPIHQLEAGRIHHRLASMYHKSYRGDYVVESETRRHHLKQLAELHYSKAENLFLLLDDQIEYLKIIAEKIGLVEFQIDSSSGLPKLKMIKQIIDIFIRSIPMFQKLEIEEDESLAEEKANILKILLQRLQQSLLSLNKILLSKKSSKQRDNNWCKSLYSKSLKMNSQSKDFGEVFVAFLMEMKSSVADHL